MDHGLSGQDGFLSCTLISDLNFQLLHSAKSNVPPNMNNISSSTVSQILVECSLTCVKRGRSFSEPVNQNRKPGIY